MACAAGTVNGSAAVTKGARLVSVGHPAVKFSGVAGNVGTESSGLERPSVEVRSPTVFRRHSLMLGATNERGVSIGNLWFARSCPSSRIQRGTEEKLRETRGPVKRATLGTECW